MSGAATERARAGRIRAILDDLIRQRKRLEADSASAGLLEANRLGIVYWQRQLSSHPGDDRAATD